MQAEHDWMTDANFLAALFEVPDSVLVRMLLDDKRDLAGEPPRTAAARRPQGGWSMVASRLAMRGASDGCG